MIEWLFYEQSYFWNLIFWNSHPSRSFQWILVTEHLKIFFMTPILHHVKSYLETVAVLRSAHSFGWLVDWFICWFVGLVFYKKSFAFRTLPCFPGLIPAIKWQCIAWIPLARSSYPQLLWLWLWQHTAPFSRAGLMTGLSAFLSKESPVTQIFLFLLVCIFSPIPSALPSVCRSFSLLFPSSHKQLLHSGLIFPQTPLSLCSFFCFGFGLVFGGRFTYLFTY